MNTTSTWRLILSEPADGPTNMAVDESILQSVAAGCSPPTLRFYAWHPPCLSLGMAQPSADADEERLAARGWGLVRRPTGGRAILHADELTYSVAAPLDEPRVAGGVVESYRRLSVGLLTGLQILGLDADADRRQGLSLKRPGPVCFETPSHYEITAGGKKLIGSAQARKGGGVLQHGTLPLAGDLSRICDVLTLNDEEARTLAGQHVWQRAATLEQVLGRVVDWMEVAQAMAQGFEQALTIRLEPGVLTTDELERTAQLRVEKFAAPAWTRRV